MFCINCGQRMPDHARYCVKCGQALSEQQAISGLEATSSAASHQDSQSGSGTHFRSSVLHSKECSPGQKRLVGGAICSYIGGAVTIYFVYGFLTIGRPSAGGLMGVIAGAILLASLWRTRQELARSGYGSWIPIGLAAILSLAAVVGVHRWALDFDTAMDAGHAADVFLEAFSSGDMERAMEYMSTDPNSTIPPEQLQKALREVHDGIMVLLSATATRTGVNQHKVYLVDSAKLDGPGRALVPVVWKVGGREVFPQSLIVLRRDSKWKVYWEGFIDSAARVRLR